MNKKIITIVSALILLISAFYVFSEKSDFYKIDKCLDSGGSWNYELGECIKCESDFIQMTKAKGYSVKSSFEIENR